jgi:hypothetical protein
MRYPSGRNRNVTDANKTRPVEWLTFVVVLLGFAIACLVCYYTKVQADAASGKLTSDVNLQFETIRKEMNGTHERVVKLETLTKLANDVAALQAKVSELQTKSTTPTENKSLADFSGLLAGRQQRWSTALTQNPPGSTQVPPLQNGLVIPPDLSWLPKEDKKGLDSLLVQANQNWKLPTLTPLPDFKLPAPPPAKPFPENIWEIVKDYPVVVIFLVILVITAFAKAGKK